MSATLKKPSLNEAAGTVEQRGRLSARTNFDPLRRCSRVYLEANIPYRSSCTREHRRHGSKFVRAESLPRCSTVPAASFNEGFYKVALICVFEARLHQATSQKPHRSANSGDEVIECERTRVHRSVLLGLIGSILGWADRKGNQWLCRRGDLVSQRRK